MRPLADSNCYLVPTNLLLWKIANTTWIFADKYSKVTPHQSGVPMVEDIEKVDVLYLQQSSDVIVMV